MNKKISVDKKTISKFKKIIYKESYKKLFCLNNNQEYTPIIICDTERSGTKQNEIIELAAIKIYKNNKEIFYKECDARHGIEPKVLSKLLNKKREYYLGKAPIDEYFEEISNFFKDNVVYFFGANEDLKSFEELYKIKEKKMSWDHIDIQKLVKEKYDTKDLPSLEWAYKTIVNNNKYELEKYSHNALLDAFKLILIIKKNNKLIFSNRHIL